MSDRATLRRLLREHAEAVSTEIAFIKEDAILRLFDTVQNEHDAQVAALTAALDGDPHQTATPEQRRAWRASAIRYADKLEAQVAALTAALQAANEDAAFHPRAAKLMRKKKNFIAIACDEPYFMDAYDLIRDSEMQKGTWTVEDQWHYDDAKAAHRARVGETK